MYPSCHLQPNTLSRLKGSALILNSPIRPHQPISSIQAPSNAIELQLQLGGLAFGVQLVVTEALDRILATAGAAEVPMPDDVAAVGDVGEDGVHAGIGRGVGEGGDIGCFACGGDGVGL